MRLYKKAAAVLLAAAMAVSMMTACGGGAGGGNGGNGGNTGAIPSAPTPEEIVLPKDDGEGEGTTTKTPLKKADSWLVAFQSTVGNDCYFAGSQSSYNASGTQTEELKMTMATTANKVYVDMTGWGLEAGKKEDHTITLYVESGKASAVYALNKSAKAGMKMNVSADAIKGITDGFGFSDKNIPAMLYSTKVKVGGTEYYAETYVQNGNEYYTCFGTDKRPKYQIEKSAHGMNVSAYQEIVLDSDMGMCDITDYTIYTLGSDTQGNTVLVDENKNVFSVEIVKDTNGKLIKMTVKDANGGEATERFSWLADLLNEFGKL